MIPETYVRKPWLIVLVNIQIMNGYECDGTDIFIRWKMECSIQRGEAKLNRTFHLSPKENIMYTIARIKDIHYLFYITSGECIGGM